MTSVRRFPIAGDRPHEIDDAKARVALSFDGNVVGDGLLERVETGATENHLPDHRVERRVFLGTDMVGSGAKDPIRLEQIVEGGDDACRPALHQIFGGTALSGRP